MSPASTRRTMTPRRHRVSWHRGAAVRAALVAGAALGLAVGTGGCEKSPDMLLGAPGGAGECFSEFRQIQVVGDFTDPAWTIPISPEMRLGGDDCAWRAVVRFNTAGEHLFKFVTGGAFDNPEDFGGDEGTVLPVGRENPVSRGVTGPGTAIKVDIPRAGCYEVRLYDTRERFILTEVPCASGGIRGVLAFENVTQPPLPRARVQALLDGAVAATDSSEDDGSFLIDGLEAGTYEVVATAFGFLEARRGGITVDDVVVDVDTLRLAEGCVSSFTSVQLVGEVTTPEWTIDISPSFTQVEGCVWELEAAIEAGVKRFKLVTDGAFDNPPDFGGDESVVLSIDSTLAVQPVSGEGTALQVMFPFTGTYVFTLDEESLTLTIRPGDVPGSLAGVVVFEGAIGSTLPVATVRVVDDAGAEAARGTTSAADGTFLLDGIDQGLYTVYVEPPLAPPTHLDVVITNVGIGGSTRNLGQIFSPRATGGLRGQVSFLNATGPPWPPATIEVRLADSLATAVATTADDTAFEVLGLKVGDYDVTVHAEGFFDTTFVVPVTTVVADVGTVGIERIVCAAFPTIETMQLGGQRVGAPDPADQTFSFNPNLMPFMTRTGRCTWELDVTAQFLADYRIKFVTNGNFVDGDPPAFGGDDVTVIPPDSTASIQPDPVPGIGNAVRIRVDSTGVYRFTIDIDALTFTWTRIADLPPDDGPPTQAAAPWEVRWPRATALAAPAAPAAPVVPAGRNLAPAGVKAAPTARGVAPRREE